MDPLNMLFAGVGGQGILFVSKIFFEAAMARGWKVMGAETHGMSQRGGSVVSHFKMGDQSSTMIIPGTADVVVGLELTEGLRSLEFLRPGGVYLVNAPDLSHIPLTVMKRLQEMKVEVHHFDADSKALANKKPLTANLYLVGYLSGLNAVPFEYDELRGFVDRLSKPAFAQDNLNALKAGNEGAKGHSC